MDSPPAKRRRTSPRLAARSNNEDGAGDNNNATTPSAAAETPRAKTPSFASPTRASMARYDLDIELRRSLSRGTPIQRHSALRRTPPQAPTRASSPPKGGNAKSSALETNQASQQRATVAANVAAEARTAETTTAEDANTNPRPLQQPPVRSPTRRSGTRSPSRSPTRWPGTRSPSRSPSRRLQGSMLSEPPVQSPLRGQLAAVGASLFAEPPHRSPMKPVPRPLPPPDPARNEDVLEPLVEAARERQRRAVGGGLEMFRTREAPPPEPELPPTPDHPDPDLTTSPPGIHNVSSSTPTKPRTTRRNGYHSAIAGSKPNGNVPSSSSPLKKPPLQPPRSKVASTKEGTEIVMGHAQANATNNAHGKGDRTSSRMTRNNSAAAARGIKKLDPDAAQRAERDALLAEISGLEADLALAATETTRIREAALAGKEAPPAPNAHDIVSLLWRRALPAGHGEEDSTARDVTANWLQAAANPIAFLPFGKPATDVGSVAELIMATAAPPSLSNDHSDIVSHHPVPMTADEELPYLQAFTPLAFESQIVVLPTSPAEPTSTTAPLLQKHIITVASTTPASLFRARIEMTVNSKSLRITELHVPRIEPLAAAVDLQPLLDQCRATTSSECSTAGSISKGCSSALLRNMTVLTWAMGEWVRVAVRRARFWVALERRIGVKPGVVTAASVLAGVRARQTRQKKLKRQRRQQQRRHHLQETDREVGSGSDDSGQDDEEDGDERTVQLVVSETELLAHAGRTAMDLDLPLLDDDGSSRRSTGLRVQWTIEFDWTGEAQSHLGLLLGMPGKWRKADDRGRLARLPRLFDQLVQGTKDPVTAVETVVSLLMGGSDDGA